MVSFSVCLLLAQHPCLLLSHCDVLWPLGLRFRKTAVFTSNLQRGAEGCLLEGCLTKLYLSWLHTLAKQGLPPLLSNKLPLGLTACKFLTARQCWN